MFISPKQKSLFSLFLFTFFLFTLNINNYAQCGVYTKHIYTEMFPYDKVHVDNSEDMTGDGIPDLILSGEAPSSLFRRDRIYILPNNGNGTFGQPTIINAPSQSPFSDDFLIGNINNDSLKDIVVVFSDYPGSGLAYINNGNGTFTAQTTFTIPQIGRPIFLLDINNDGFGDYLGIASSGEFKFSLGNGDGTFASPVVLNSNGIGHPGDFNNDGAIDFINSRTLFINQGSGNFTTTDITAIINNQILSGIRDFNGDGRTDLMLAINSGFAILTKTDTSFDRTEYIVPTGNNTSTYGIVGNFSGNSLPDILFETKLPSGKIIYENDGSGNFTRREFASNFKNYTYPFHESQLNDFDNDGKTDWLIATSGISNSTLMFKDKTSFTFQKNVCDRPGQPRIVDFDRSGTTDYSFWNPSTGNWTYQTNTRYYNERQTETVNWGLGSLGDIPMPGDFDGDGITDFSVYRNSTGVWYIRRSSDLQWFVFQFGLTGDKPVAADYDGDTISDIAVWRPSDGNWYIWYMGTQQFSAVHFGLDGDKPVPADFDGDLKTDVAVFRPSTGVWYYLKSSDGNFAAIQWGIGSDKPMPADFDGDGNADPAVYRDSENTLYVLKSYDYSFAGFNWGTSQDMPFVGDFDGDFVADFGVYRPSTKQWWQSNILLGSAVLGEDNSILTSTIPGIE
ncbi:hypothetical protein BH20ACI4_BH20ACI4_18880 [soil metagenome]